MDRVLIARLLWRLTVVLAVSSASDTLLLAQGSRADYERAEALEQQTRNRVARQLVRPNWLDGRAVFWYRVQTGIDTHRFVLVDCEREQREPAFDHQRLADSLQEAMDQKVDPDRLPFRAIRYSADLNELFFSAGDRRWQCSLRDYRVTLLESDGASLETTVQQLPRPRRSRDQGSDTAVRFVNQLARPVRLYWIDRGGQRVAYGEIAGGQEREQHTFVGHVWLVTDLEDQTLAVYRAVDGEGDAIIDGNSTVEAERPPRERGTSKAESPDGQWRAVIRDHNVWLTRIADDQTCQLSRNGSQEDPYLERFAWSPDSSKLVAMQESQVTQRKVHLIESSPPDQLQPQLHELPYTKPGDPWPRARPRLFDVATRELVETPESLFNNPWEISEIRWRRDSSRFTFLYNQRGHQVLRLVAVDAATGNASPLIDETSDTFIDYAHKEFIAYLDERDEIVWMSERDGWNHLYLYDAKDGRVKNQITRGPWVVRSVERVDEQQGRVWFYAGGVDPELDPYYLHYCRIDLDGSDLVVLTPGDGTHTVESSPDGRFLIDRYSRVDLPPITELRAAADGRLICELERADASALEATGWRYPKRFVSTGRDGVTPIFGVVFLPQSYDSGRKYPVIEKIYAGPHGSFVPKAFSSYYNEQSIAELGFIVVQIDGMGTSHRSKAFHDVCWKNLADSGFPDRIRWLQAAAQQFTGMDLQRVGIYGGSAGGQSALRALLAHPDKYHVAVADCGCHDNRMDKIWWNELWMGWPVGPHYEQQSNVTQAGQLQGKLLLTVAELDRNVDPASTMQVVNALIAADKDFELIVFPGADHGIGESRYGRRRRRDFFVRHLLGVEPRWTSDSRPAPADSPQP